MVGYNRHKQLIYIPILPCGIYFHVLHHLFDKIPLKLALLFSERFSVKFTYTSELHCLTYMYMAFFSLMDDISCNDLCPI